MFKLNERALVADLAEALKDENGVFLITEPSGDTLQIRIEAGHFLIDRSTSLPQAKRTDLLWAITKLGDLPEAASCSTTR
jgi:hypothetical protein